MSHLSHRVRNFSAALVAGVALLGLALLGGCRASVPVEAHLRAARSALEQARADPATARHAAGALEQASATLTEAELRHAQRDSERARHLAYLAQRQAETAQAIGAQATHQAVLENAGRERERILLSARVAEATARADEAEAARQQAQAGAQQAQREAGAARAQAEQAGERAQALRQDLQSLQARDSARGPVVTLGGLLFAPGQATLYPGALRGVGQLAQVLQRHPQRRVLIEGFTDSQGPADANQALSQRRAEGVAQALVRQGVDATRIETQGHGEAYPVASNANAAGRQLNRRVEVLFSDEQGRIAPPR